jgi:hypothetical protein
MPRGDRTKAQLAKRGYDRSELDQYQQDVGEFRFTELVRRMITRAAKASSPAALAQAIERVKCDQRKARTEKARNYFAQIERLLWSIRDEQ